MGVRPHTMDCKWTLEEAAAEEVTKKHKINKSAVKKLSKDKALAAYKELLDPPAAEPEVLEACPAPAPAEEAAKEFITIHVNFIDLEAEEREPVSLQVEQDYTIARVKALIETQEGIQAESILLFKKRTRIADDDTLKQLKVEAG